VLVAPPVPVVPPAPLPPVPVVPPVPVLAPPVPLLVPPVPVAPPDPPAQERPAVPAASTNQTSDREAKFLSWGRAFI
jgi:hypothetical protein